MLMGVLHGTIPSAVSDTGATSSLFLKEDPSISTGRVSSVVFHLPNSAVTPATTVKKLLHNVLAPPPRMSTLSLHWLKTHSSAPANLPTWATQPSRTRMRSISLARKPPKSQSQRMRCSKDGVAPARSFDAPLWSPLSPTSTQTLSSWIIHQVRIASTPCTPLKQTRSPVNSGTSNVQELSPGVPSTTYTNSPALNRPFGTSMARRASQQKPPGSRLFANKIISPGHSSMN